MLTETQLTPKIIEYSNRLKKADHLIFIFPIWWELMPALTKGFIDRALFPGIAYDHNPKGHGLIPIFKNLKVHYRHNYYEYPKNNLSIPFGKCY